MNTVAKWIFVPNNNAGLTGINDAGIETFTAKVIPSLVRETIQNSMDAKLAGEDIVKIEYKTFEIQPSDFPDYNGYMEVLKKCRDSNSIESGEYTFFKNAIGIMNKHIKVLRVSDYNTSGLTGADTCKKGTVWSRLVKESGSSDKASSSGGSFGIGKSAAFACSDLRTIFYSSLDKDGIESNIGVSRLVSFENQPDQWTTGLGYYSDNEKLTAIHSQLDIDGSYIRNTPGTDIYIMGVGEFDVEEVINSVISNFMVSIWKGKLEVIVEDQVIGKENLYKYIEKLNPEKDKELIDYYQLLTSNSPEIKRITLNINDYGKEFGFSDGDCTLYLMEGENLNRKVMMTREAGMRLFDQNRISGSISFTGILMITGTNMNKYFRQMEVPSHDAWEPGRCKENKTQAKKMYIGLKSYIKLKVQELFASVSEEQVDAFGASDFLPDVESTIETGIKQKSMLSDKINKIERKEMKPTTKKAKTEDNLGEQDFEFADLGGSSGDDDGGEHGGTGTNTGKGTGGPNEFGGSGSGDDDGGKGGNLPDEKKNSDVKYRLSDVKKRIMCTNMSSGKYIVKFNVPASAQKAYMEFALIGEQSNFKLPIEEATLVEGQGCVTDIQENKIYFENVKKGNSVKLQVKFGFNQYCLMEANYYATKK